MRCVAQLGGERERVDAVDGERHDPAALAPEVVDRHPGNGRPTARGATRRARRRAPAMASAPSASASSAAAPSPSRPATLCSQLSKRRASSRSIEPVGTASTARRGRRRTAGRAARSTAGARRGTPVPAGRAGTCARWPRGSRSRARSTSTGSWPTAWHASSRYGTPAARVTSPTAAAGFTSPPWVGIHDIATSRTGGPDVEARPRSASTESAPCSSSGTTSTRAPVRCADLERAEHVARVLGP